MKRGPKPKFIEPGTVLGIQRVIKCNHSQRHSTAECECTSCGNVTTRRFSDLRVGRLTSCICVKHKTKEPTERLEHIFEELNKGRTQKSIADELGITKQRVQQITTQYMNRRVVFEWKEERK